MIRWMRTAQIAPGKNRKAFEWAKGITEYIKKYQNIPQTDVFMDMFGDMGIVRWSVDYDSLASLEKAQAQIAADTEWWEKMDTEASDLFIRGSVKDIVMQKI